MKYHRWVQCCMNLLTKNKTMSRMLSGSVIGSISEICPTTSNRTTCFSSYNWISTRLSMKVQLKVLIIGNTLKNWNKMVVFSSDSNTCQMVTNSTKTSQRKNEYRIRWNKTSSIPSSSVWIKIRGYWSTSTHSRITMKTSLCTASCARVIHMKHVETRKTGLCGLKRPICYLDSLNLQGRRSQSALFKSQNWKK